MQAVAQATDLGGFRAHPWPGNERASTLLAPDYSLGGQLLQCAPYGYETDTRLRGQFRLSG